MRLKHLETSQVLQKLSDFYKFSKIFSKIPSLSRDHFQVHQAPSRSIDDVFSMARLRQTQKDLEAANMLRSRLQGPQPFWLTGSLLGAHRFSGDLLFTVFYDFTNKRLA